MMGFVGAMKSYFGFQAGQSLASFAAEIKSIPPKDKQEFWEMLQSAGQPCLKPSETEAKK